MGSDFEPKQFGKYLLTQRIAVGGMAEIYKAKTYGVDGFEKELAIKRILPHCSADKDFITMLVDEAKLSVLLSHANIVQVYDLSKVGDDYYIAMEYIHGVNLRDIMYRCREGGAPLSADIAVYIASEMCKGLDYAHRKTDQENRPLNIVHRDVSPQNILISYEGEVKIVDFGIAKAAMNISHTLAGILKGKIAYMSPEQAMGKTVDSRTDIFSTGILLYEMLTGTKLYTGESQFEVLKKIRTTKIGVDSLPENIPEDLRPIVVKALAYDADERYQNAGDLQIELTKYLYSKHVDFSPRKLAAFIKKLFADEIRDEQAEKAREVATEGLTSTMNIQEGAKQVSIVHREGVSLEADTDTTGRRPKEKAFETVITPSERPPEAPPPAEVAAAPKKKKKKPVRNAIAAMILISVAAYGLFKFVPGLRFWEAPPEEAVTIGSVSITSDPAGAKIIIDGKDTGRVTPSVIEDLEADKTYNVRLEKADMSPAESPVDIKADKQAALNLRLEPPTGALNVISEPDGAAIALDGKLTGKSTPATLENLKLNTDLRITLAKPDYEDFEQTISLTSSRPQKVSAKLEKILPKTGILAVESMPSGAKVLIDGKDTGRTTPAQIANLEPKQYDVTLRLEGHKDWTKSYDVAAEKSVPVKASLVAEAPPTELPPAEKVTEKPPTTEIPEEAPEEEPEEAPEEEPEKVAEEKKPEEKKPEAALAELVVTSTPSGASILLDGKSTGKRTPTTLKDLKPGATYRITVSKDGYERASSRKALTKDKNTLAMRLTKTPEPETKPPVETRPVEKPETKPTVETGKPGKIKVTSNPSGADVFINQQYKGKTPLTASVSPGTATVLISKEGAAKVSRTVTVQPGKTVSLANIQLGGLYGEVSLTSEPPAAQVIFDGQPIPARTPVTIRKVRTDRTHTVTITMPGYRSWSRSFSMEGGSKSFHAPLQPQ
jgi:serine/threonine protein kinase